MNDKLDSKTALRFAVKRLSRRTSTKIPFMRDIIELNNQDRDEVPDAKTMTDMIQKTLTIEDTRKGKNDLVYFSYDKLEWLPIQRTDDNVIKIFNQNSSYNHINDKAHEDQKKYHSLKQDLIEEALKSGNGLNLTEKDIKKSIRNQLTFAERTSQTVNTEIIQRNAETAKLERNTHSGMVHKWEIFDRYVEKYIIQQETEKRKEMQSKMGVDKKAVELNEEINLRKEEKQEELSRPSMVKVLKLVEKQILQTLNEDQYKLYREWDKSEVNNGENQVAMVLPFPKNNSVKNRSVTAIVWNHKFEDLFAVGYGNYKFPLKQNDKEKDEKGEEKSDDTLEPGYIFIFSVKNNHYPEIRYTTESWVLSLDFHKTEPYFLVAGTYDGNVSVYDIKLKSKFPIITCDIRNQKHMDPVWQVKWFNSEVSSTVNVVNSANPNSVSNLNDTEYTFFSISSDGKVFKWSFIKNKTTFDQEEIVVLKYTNTQNELANNGYDIDSKEKGEENLVFGNSGGTCFDFSPHYNKKEKDLFIIGTEEGHIQLCSVNHRGHYIKSFEGHTMGVYSIAWNPYHEKMFASCSADWTIKIWHIEYKEPLIIFDMDQAVGDVAWSPWCSSIFSCVTVNGQIKFFDLIASKKTPIYEKKYKDTPINHISFNRFEYVFLTGNDSGKVRMWKMAETLRETKNNQDEDEKEEEKKGAKENQVQVTKVVVPRNLQINKKKKRNNVIVNKDKKNEILKDPKHIANERDRLVEFLNQFDIYEEKDEKEVVK